MVFDAWAFLSGGVLLCFIGLTMTAWNSPSSYLPGLLAGPTPSPYDDAVMVISNQSLATAFIINGLILLALSWGLTLVRTIACSRLAEILRWIIPAHVLGGLIELALATWVMADEQEMKTAAAWVWLGVAAFTSLGFALASVRRQWRPFLVSGLLGLASIYVILMMRLKMEFQESPQTFDWIAISTVAGLCIVGILAMLASPHMQGKPSQK